MQDSSFRKDIEIGIVALATFIAFAIIFFIAPKRGEVIVINCTWSEISPDFTVQMKEACREARIKSAQKDLQKPK